MGSEQFLAKLPQILKHVVLLDAGIKNGKRNTFVLLGLGRYLQSLLRTTRLDALLAKHTEMSSEIKNLDSDMQMLVYENYNRFISATDTIRTMKSNVDGMDSSMQELEKVTGRLLSNSSEYVHHSVLAHDEATAGPAVFIMHAFPNKMEHACSMHAFWPGLGHSRRSLAILPQCATAMAEICNLWTCRERGGAQRGSELQAAAAAGPDRGAESGEKSADQVAGRLRPAPPTAHRPGQRGPRDCSGCLCRRCTPAQALRAQGLPPCISMASNCLVRPI